MASSIPARSSASTQFEGLTVAGLSLETDPDAIEDFANANPGFDPGELYEA